MFTADELDHINSYLSKTSAEKIIEWSIITIPGLHQTSALGLSGLVTIDMISKMFPSKNPVHMIFFDTLHHFKETLNLLERVIAQYPNTKVHVFRPEAVNSEAEFANKNGEKLWETNELLYDYLVKVEPADRAYKELGVKAVFTGRRRSQGGDRANLQPVEITEDGLIKINPMFNWSFDDVRTYIKKHNVPYNELLDKGYRSVGDYHSTEPVKEGEDERAGRWKGKAKTECGIHDTGRFAQLRN